jgi:UDPglucose--hexose-1-phosphate uridylyltransferase
VSEPAPPEFRVCPATGRTVILAPGRAARPHDARGDVGPCPFCPGQEHETPPETYAIRDANGWRVRVVPNRYPAVRPDAPAFGYHELLVECREHVERPIELAVDQLADVFRAYRDRLAHHFAMPRVEAVSIFKNVGVAAGASREHAHSQLVALPFVPSGLVSVPGPCAVCRMPGETDRLVARSEHFATVCPTAPRFANEVWIVPTAHEPRFEATDRDAELARFVRRVLRAMDALLDRPAFNWMLVTAPREAAAEFHWRLEIVPRRSAVAGFEWATGVFINDVAPERAAARLRDKLPS